MPEREHQFFRVEELGGGIRQDMGSDMIPDNSFTHLLNFEYDKQGALKSRGGQAEYNATGVTGASYLDNGVRFYNIAANTYTTMVSANCTGMKIFRAATSGTFSEVTGGSGLTTAMPVSFAVFRDNLFMVNGYERMQYYTTGATKATCVFSDNARLGKYVCIADNRVWLAGDPSAKNRIYVSDDGLYTTDPVTDCSFPTNNYIDILSDNGDVITGMVSYENEVYIFRNADVWVVRGEDALDWQCVRVINGAGAVGQRAIAATPQGIVFVDRNTIYMWHPRGSEPVDIGILIQDVFKDYDFSGAVCGYDSVNDKVYVSFKHTESYNDRSAIFDLSRQCWTQFSYGAASYICNDGGADNGEFYRVSAENAGDWTGKVMKLGTGSQDDAADFTCEAYTKDYIVNKPELDNTFRAVYLWMYALDDTTPVSISAYIDRGKQTLSLGSYTLRGFNRWGDFVYGEAPYGGGTYQRAAIPFPSSVRGSTVQLRYTKTTSDAITLFRHSIEHRERGLWRS